MTFQCFKCYHEFIIDRLRITQSVKLLDDFFIYEDESEWWFACPECCEDYNLSQADARLECAHGTRIFELVGK
jgi:hypothetical protein